MFANLILKWKTLQLDFVHTYNFHQILRTCMCAYVFTTHMGNSEQRSVASHSEMRNPITLDSRPAGPQASRDSCLPRSSCTAMAGARFCVCFDVDLGYLNSDSPASVQALDPLSHLPNTASSELCAQAEVTERLIPQSGTCALGKSMWPCRCVALLTVLYGTTVVFKAWDLTSSGATKLSLGQCLGSVQFPCSNLVLCGQSIFFLKMQLLAFFIRYSSMSSISFPSFFSFTQVWLHWPSCLHI